MIQTNQTVSYNRTRLRLEAWLQNPAIQYAALLAVTAFATLLRYYKLGAWSFWIDEVYNIHYAQELWEGISILDQPSLILISIFLKNYGINHFNARLVPAVIGVLTIPILFFPLRKMFGRATALLGVLLIALSPWHLYWSQNSRFYSALMLFYALAACFIYYGLEKDRPLYYLLALLFFGLAMQERRIAGFWALAVGAYVLALYLLPRFGRPAGLNRRNVLLAGIPTVLFLLYQGINVAFLGGEFFFQGFIDTFIGYQHNPLRVLLSIIYDLGLPLFLLGLVGAAYLLRRGSRVGLFLVINAVLPVILLVAISPFTQSFSRYVFVTLPAWAALAAYAVIELFDQVSREGRLLAFGLLAVLLIDPISQDMLYYQYQNGNRPDWRGAFKIVEQSMASEDRVITTRVEIGEYYLRQDVEWTQGLDPREVEADGRRTWFVIDNGTGFISPKLDAWLQEEPRLVAVRDVHIPGKNYLMRVYRYDP